MRVLLSEGLFPPLEVRLEHDEARRLRRVVAYQAGQAGSVTLVVITEQSAANRRTHAASPQARVDTVGDLALALISAVDPQLACADRLPAVARQVHPSLPRRA
jgi:hypothetical protein